VKNPATLRVARIAAVLAAALLLAVPAAAGTDRYVALGDSFSSGVGTGSYALSTPCRRSVFGYPYLLSRLRAGTSLVFAACSGATIADLMANQIQSVNGNTSIVTVTIGGNDIGFASLIYRCTLADCSAALDSTRRSLESVLGSRLNIVYAAIKARAAPGAKIVVLGYPHMFGSSTCPQALGVTARERLKANQLADALDLTIAAHTRLVNGVIYKSAISSFATHPVCSASPWLNGLNLLSPGESYHPTRRGHRRGYLPLVRAVTG
jgi:hypothetical protein